MKNGSQKEIRYFSMFTGVGGFELGISQAEEKRVRKENEKELRKRGNQFNNETDKRLGDSKTESQQYNIKCANRQFTCVGFSENEKYCSELLKQKFPNIKNYGDATKIIPEELPNFELLVGGFPCQAFSIAGKRKGFTDTRGTLFHDIVRIAKVKRPKYLLLENVKGLLSHDRGRTFAVILTSLSELGYVIQWMVLNSKFFGVPQNRERVFIIGSLRGESLPEILPLERSNQNITEESDKKPSESQTITATYWKGGKGTQIKLVQKSDREYSRIYSPEGVSPTLHLKTGGWQEPKIVASRGRNPKNPSDRTVGSPTEQMLEINESGTTNTLSSVQKDNMVLEDTKVRRLTPLECERLQGFPDGWTEGFSDTQRYKMMGNAVTVNVIKAIIEKWFGSH